MDDEEVLAEGSEAVLAPGVDRVMGRLARVAPKRGATPPSSAGGKPEKGGKNLNFDPGLGGTGRGAVGTTSGTKSLGGMYLLDTLGTGIKPTKSLPSRTSLTEPTGGVVLVGVGSSSSE